MGAIENNSILIKIKAPTKGWLAVGFNDKNEIVGSDLKMFRVKNDQLDCEDQFVIGIQSHPNDEGLQGKKNIKLLKGQETNEGTSVIFKIPMTSNDLFDFSHEIDQNFWLILVYSASDDFSHHSVIREHFQIKWSGLEVKE